MTRRRDGERDRRDTRGRNPGRSRGGRAGGRKKKSSGRRWLRPLVIWGGTLAIWVGVVLAAVVGWYAYDLPTVADMDAIERRPSVTVMAADGTLLASYGDLYGATVHVRDLPPYLPQAVLAIEDRRFYSHFGIDVLGLARALLVNLRAGRVVEGGSTVTQQLAKNLFLTPERTLKRKVQEALLALWLERKFTKDEILSLYLNRVYLGAGTYGVDAAARRYFGKPATAVNLYEAALLAGLLKAPSRYSPARDEERSDARTELVLRAMVDAGHIAPDEAARALHEKTQGRATAGNQARYFADWILAQVSDYVGVVNDDLVVISTLNPVYQTIAEEELAAVLDEAGAKRGVEQGGVVLMDSSGAVRALVGGRDYDGSQFNRATQALRQPGSAFKLFVFLAALEEGYLPGDRMMDGPIAIKDWRPSNYNDTYLGEVSLQDAFARSLNSVAVRLTQAVGPAKVASTARRLGITSDLALHPSIALGTSEVSLLEMTGAYAVFANKGRAVWPFGIREIRGRDGALLYRRSGDGPGHLVRPRDVAAMTELMAATVAWGSGKAANPGRPAAGKTGTSQEFRDAWFVGFTAQFVGGVWLGNDDGTPTKAVTGGSLPARVWQRTMLRAHEGLATRPLPGAEIPMADATPTPAPQNQRSTPSSRQEGGFISRILRSLGSGSSSEDASERRTPVRTNEP